MNTHMLAGRYKVLQSLASGGMGQTFRAEDTQLPGNPICVVKQLKPATADPNFIATAKRLFFSEAETLQKLGTHDQIPRLLAYFEEDNEFYLVQDYIEGNTLNQEIVLGQRWSEAQVVQLLQDILEILTFVHSHNVIHRDIKPENIIRRTSDRKLVLIDFGAVKESQVQNTNLGGQTSNTVAIGTHGYMPVEQVSGQPRMNSDLYAVGKIAIQALTGLLPTQLNEDQDGELIWRDQARVSDGLAQFLTKMVHNYHKLRYQTSYAALQALYQLTNQPNTPPSVQPFPQTQAAPSPARPTVSIPETTAQQSHSTPPHPTTPSAPGEAPPPIPNPPIPNDVKTSDATLVISPAGPQSLNQTPGETPSNVQPQNKAVRQENNRGNNNKLLIIVGCLLFFALLGNAIVFGYLNRDNPVPPTDGVDQSGQPQTPPEEVPPEEIPPEEVPPEEVPPEESLPPDPDAPIKRSDFPKASCGDSNTTKPFYRVYIRNVSLEKTIKEDYCQDAYLETKTNRVKVASFDTKEGADNFKAFMEENVGAVEIDRIAD